MCERFSIMNDKELEVKEVLKTLQPAMEADGGGVELVSVIDDVVTVRFKGACLLCPSIGMTMKFGVAKTLQEKLPWVTNVIKTK
jgi:Fe-S cluster biogenesis protein NfuA